MHVLQAVAGLQVCIYAECAVEATNYCFVQLITQDDVMYTRAATNR